ncbi:hypothetical protein EV586_107127 [Tumebacillus sp. BK434]|uniref:hypothetical protein n=1 Tax=Tumebacillus sp. BK434 TaxID=2512169 RepID=UPI00104D4AFF|nr:hypothetical protein [Tumebacillus sp. BK434]TCP52884.1 hypothetical protein EV586_107127 [Tumebacillus sp. BK434]
MTVRGQLEAQVLQKMEEAEAFLKTMREERLAVDDPRFVEWQQGVDFLLWFAFGELAPHTRTWRRALAADVTLHVYYSRLSGCLYRAQKLLQNGVPNPLRPAPDGLILPVFAINRRHRQEQLADLARWRLFFAAEREQRGKL